MVQGRPEGDGGRERWECGGDESGGGGGVDGRLLLSNLRFEMWVKNIY